MPNLTRRTCLRGSALVALGTPLLVACGDTPVDVWTAKGKRLTQAQAELMAIARFGNYRRERVQVRLALPGDPAFKGQVTIDYRTHHGFGTFVDAAGATNRLAWDGQRIATHAQGDVNDAGSWSVRAMDRGVVLDLFLQVVLSLASDRPENPQLLRQSDARFFDKQTVGKVSTSVLSGPSSSDAAADNKQGTSRTRFWLDKDGNIVRFAADLGNPDRLIGTARFDVSGKPDPLPEVVATLFPSRSAG